MELTAENLPDDLQLCQQIIRELLDKNQQSQVMIKKLHHQLEQLLKSRYGPRADRIHPDQRFLFSEMLKQLEEAKSTAQLPTEKEKPIEPKKEKAGKKGHGRKPLPAHLPRKRIEHDIPQEERICANCGNDRICIGMEKSEQLEYVPASLFVQENVYLKYACKHCEEGVATASRPLKPIEKGLPGCGLLAQVAVSKYSDHLPLARQEDIFKRHGVEIARSTQCDWMHSCAELLFPLYDRMKAKVLSSKVIWTDDTPVPVRDKKLSKTRQGRIWVYRGDESHPYIVFDYTQSRKRDGPIQFLSGFEGYLQADAYGGYDGIYATKVVTEVACWAHARRKFADAQSTDPERAVNALARIRMLYDVEAASRDLSAEARAEMRATQSKPVLNDFESWLQEEQRNTLPKSPIGEAISYALSNWAAFIRYVDDGDLSIDNNAAERALRAIAVGRKNWNFFGSDRGGRTAAILYSFTQSARRHDLDPFEYLRDVIDRISSMPMSRIDELLPDQWTRLRESSSPS
jgi:transposase